MLQQFFTWFEHLPMRDACILGLVAYIIIVCLCSFGWARFMNARNPREKAEDEELYRR